MNGNKHNSTNNYIICPVDGWERYCNCFNCNKPAIGYVGKNPRQTELGTETTFVENVCSDVTYVQAIVRNDRQHSKVA